MKMRKIWYRTMGIFVLAAVLACTACGKKEEEAMQPAETAEGRENLGETAGEAQEKEPAETEETEEPAGPEVTELSEAAQLQLSSFIGTAVSSMSNYEKGYIDEAVNYDTLFQNGVTLELVVNYIHEVHEVQPEALPFQWGTFAADAAWDTEPQTGKYQVSREEIERFFESGWGVSLPEDMETKFGEAFEEGFFYGVELGENGLGVTWDMGLLCTYGESVEITGYEDGIYTLAGTFCHGDISEMYDQEDLEPFRFHFTATAVESGDPEIFDGLQITGFQVEGSGLI